MNNLSFIHETEAPQHIPPLESIFDAKAYPSLSLQGIHQADTTEIFEKCDLDGFNLRGGGGDSDTASGGSLALDFDFDPLPSREEEAAGMCFSLVCVCVCVCVFRAYSHSH